jgi:hypothetical protein
MIKTQLIRTSSGYSKWKDSYYQKAENERINKSSHSNQDSGGEVCNTNFGLENCNKI